MRRLTALLFIAILANAGCNDPKTTPPPITPQDAKVKSNLDQLSAEDRSLAESQRSCPISQEPLGTEKMGVPIKIMIKDKPVFLCCKSCEKRALDNPDKTLQDVEDLKQAGGKR